MSGVVVVKVQGVHSALRGSHHASGTDGPVASLGLREFHRIIICEARPKTHLAACTLHSVYVGSAA